MAEINYEQISLEIITNAGEAKSFAMEAIQLAKEGKRSEAEASLEKGVKVFENAHHAHFEAVTQEAEGKQLDFKLLLVHAEDQLMTTQLLLDLTKHFIDLYSKK